MRRWVLGLAMMLPLSAGAAEGLAAIYRDALSENAGFRANQAESEVKRAESSMAWSRLLPSLSASASQSRNRTDRTAPNLLGVTSTTPFNYNSQNLSLNLRQPLFRLDSWATAQQAEHQSLSAEADLRRAEQELAVKVVSAYCDALYAQDQIRLILAQRETMQMQLQAAQRSFSAGMGTLTDIDEAQAKLDLLDVQRLEAEDRAEDTHQTLAAMIGRPVGELEPLIPERMDLSAPFAGKVDDWLAQVEAGNPQLGALREQMQAAEQELVRAYADHLPSVDLVASAGSSTNDNLAQLSNAGNTQYQTRSLGIQVSVPLFSGGYASAGVQRGNARVAQAHQRYEEARRGLSSDILRAHGDLTHGIVRIKALERAERSAEKMVLSSKKSVTAGTRTTIDVLLAEQQVHSLRRDLAEARYKLVISRLRLLSFAGRINTAEIATIGSWFGSQPTP